MKPNRRILHLVKTLDGAAWAHFMIRELTNRGWEVVVATPTLTGRNQAAFEQSGARLVKLPVELPVTRPWALTHEPRELRQFVQQWQPALVHSHFVSTTLMARWALKGMGIPRIFQVPGPLHLEHRLYGQWDTMTADGDDYWVGSSDFIRSLYVQGYQVNPARVFRSYYGIDLTPPVPSPFLRAQYHIPPDAFLIGNVSYFYAPKTHLGQSVGIKGHELMLAALKQKLQRFPDLWAIFIGGPWAGAERYYAELKEQAERMGQGRIIFTGTMPGQQVLKAWREIDLAMHLPLSENCGGVVEPLMVETPVLAAEVGGLPEVILHRQTGLICQRELNAVSENLEWALTHREALKQTATLGHQHIQMFSKEKTAAEIDTLYRRLLGL